MSLLPSNLCPKIRSLFYTVSNIFLEDHYLTVKLLCLQSSPQGRLGRQNFCCFCSFKYLFFIDFMDFFCLIFVLVLVFSRLFGYQFLSLGMFYSKLLCLLKKNNKKIDLTKRRQKNVAWPKVALHRSQKLAPVVGCTCQSQLKLNPMRGIQICPKCGKVIIS